MLLAHLVRNSRDQDDDDTSQCLRFSYAEKVGVQSDPLNHQ